MVIGFLWYGPVFGKAWMALSGRGMGEGSAAGPLYALTALAAFIEAIALNWFINETGWTTGSGGALIGLYAGLGFIATAFFSQVLFAGRPPPVRYGLAVLFTLAIAGLKLAIPAFGAPGPDLFLTIPVAASAVLAGFGPALLATIGTTLVAAYFTPPAGFAISLNTNGLDVIGFFFEGLVVAILGAVARAAFGRTAESLRRLEQLEQERSALIATVNAECRNPLASLSGYLQLASRYSRREDMRERVSPAIDEAERQVGRLVRLADDLQVISSPSAVFRMELEPFDLALAAHAAARRVEALDPAREVTVSAP